MRSAYYREWASKNREHLRAYKGNWQRENHDRMKETRRLASLKSRFGPEAPAHNLQQLEKQQGVCPLCKEPLPILTINQHQDHNHVTNQLRGVLCRRCNTGLHYMENESWRKAAEQYLLEWNSQWALTPSIQQ